MSKDEKIILKNEELDMVAGGIVEKNPNGSCDTEDKYIVKDDTTGEIIGMTGGYANARRMAEKHGQSPELKN